MHPDIEALATNLEEAEALLRKHRIFRWADWLEKDARFIRNLDFYGIEHLLSAFGGMGIRHFIEIDISPTDREVMGGAGGVREGLDTACDESEVGRRPEVDRLSARSWPPTDEGARLLIL